MNDTLLSLGTVIPPDELSDRLCACGCGRFTRKSPHNDKKRGLRAGEGQKWLLGHAQRSRHGPRVIEDENGCWVWQHALTDDGYGRCSVYEHGARRTRPAHRIFYERHAGPIPDGHDIHHICTNRACCNPAHLTPVPHGPHARLRRSTKLDEDDARMVRHLRAKHDAPVAALAEVFRVTRGSIYRIINEAGWRET